MSTIDRVSAHDSDGIEIVPNDDEGTVTFVADLEEETTAPPTEWITVATADTVDLQQYR
jgi:hypothetical protein